MMALAAGTRLGSYEVVAPIGAGGMGEVYCAREDVVADLGPLPAALDLADFQGDFPYRGFSLRPDGKSFLTSVLTVKGDLWLLEDFDRRIGWLDSFLRSP
jgi:hypothetical protein